ncbi:hypothetical protein MCOR30_005199 [Pyricularia oryzae]|nr:hypothetical protein MCOR30_005199 [Pyricularia oryzae]
MLRPSRSISSLISTESLVNITLRRLEAALEDAALGSGNETTMADTNYPSEKGIFRWARALLAGPEIMKTKKRIEEQKTGIYDYRNIATMLAGGKGLYGGRGIWLIVSVLNSDRSGNCFPSLIGNMLTFRATRAKEPDTELRYPYLCSPSPGEIHDERQDRFKNWGFQFGCELCVELLRTPAEAIRERNEIFLQATGQITGPTPGLEQLDEEFIASYHGNDQAHYRSFLDLGVPTTTAAGRHLSVGELLEAMAKASMVLRAL